MTPDLYIQLTRELSFCLLVKEFLKLVHFWRSYRQNGLIASHAMFEVHCLLKGADFAR